ncbi:MAG: restriction endonuclease subunit S [Blastocatellia bacterium]|nr:restriction endonuclease subunit S [Blastocatellia bacterium]
MSLLRYPEYKDSGVEWLGEVPKHWEVLRLKRVATVQTGVAKGKDNTGRETINVPYLRVANVQDGYLDLDEVSVIEIPVEDLPRYSLKYGDVLMNEGGDFDKLGRGHVWRCEIEPCIHQNHVFAVRPVSISADWLNLFTSTGYAQFYFMSRSKQSTNLASISSSNIVELPVLMPSPEEQSKIAAFLDFETASLSALIAEQERLIELLKEKRQAVISHAVTKGLDPNVPMKDSGIEWLGEVPAHWEVLKFQRCVFVAEGQVNPEQSPYKEMILIAPNHIESNTGRIISLETAEEQGAESGKYLCKQGDVIYCKIRPALRKVCIAPQDSLCSADMYPLRPFQGLNNGFLCWFLLSEQFSMQAILESDRVAMPKINRESLKELPITFPPFEEQTSITSFLNSETAKIDELITEAQRAIELLKERRSALISAAVTGQIDVRGWTKPEAV